MHSLDVCLTGRSLRDGRGCSSLSHSLSHRAQSAGGASFWQLLLKRAFSSPSHVTASRMLRMRNIRSNIHFPHFDLSYCASSNCAPYLPSVSLSSAALSSFRERGCVVLHVYALLLFCTALNPSAAHSYKEIKGTSQVFLCFTSCLQSH